MTQTRTHYDNLMVARNASPEVIRAAYKTLSHKFHPDRNPGNQDAARVMVIINVAYEVLSDPGKRREHDLWIAQKEAAPEQTRAPEYTQQQTSQQTEPTASHAHASVGGVLGHMMRHWYLYGFFAALVWIFVTNNLSAPLSSQKSNSAVPTRIIHKYIKPLTAPNGQPWPPSAAYVNDSLVSG